MSTNNNQSDGEKLEAGDIAVPKSKFVKLIENIWYHYKWVIIIGLFFAIVFAVGLSQIYSNEDADMNVMFAGPYILSSNEKAGINRALVTLMPDDYNKDGKKVLSFASYGVYSEDEMKSENEAYTDDDGKKIVMVYSHQNAENMRLYTSYLMSGECSVLFLSEYLYGERMKAAKDYMVPLSETFGDDIPAGALPDGYGVRLADTELYKNFPALQVLPEDTIICLNRRVKVGKGLNKEIYNRSVEFYKILVTFKAE